MAILEKITRCIDAITEWSGRSVAWLTLIIVLLGAWNALARFLSRDLLKFTDLDLSSNRFLELQWYLFAILFLVGGAYVLKQNAHVRVDVLYDRYSPKVRCLVDLIGHLLFLIPFSIFMIWISVGPVGESWRVMEQSGDPDGLPRYPIKTVIPIAFSLLLVHGINEVLKRILELHRGFAAPASEEGGQA